MGYNTFISYKAIVTYKNSPMKGSQMATTNFYSKIESVSKALNPYFTAIVPEEGPCVSVEGEAIRAWSRMAYRFYNDGDSIFEENGNTANAAFRYLTESCGLGYPRGASEEEIIFKMGEQVLGRIEEIHAEGLPYHENHEDFLDYAVDNSSLYENDDYYYGDDEDEEY